jgi:hypothetical protein
MLSIRKKLVVNDQQKLYQKDEETLMKEEPHYIKSWLKIAHRIIRTSKKEASKQYREKNLMEQYFQWQPPRKKKRQKPHRKVPHQKQDLCPD